MINKYLENNKNEIIKKAQELIQIPSVITKSQNSNYPFGKPINDALEYMLELGKSLGFKVKNLDNFCGYIEFGKGSEIIGIIGHLDVVPACDNWTYPPFSGSIHNNKIYGRGAIDDKAPCICSLYAMKAVMENYQPQKRVRLILGLNEENDWKCINYYKRYEELPSISFSPDADFPCIYAEKAVINSYLKTDYSAFLNEDITIKEINTYENPLNVVPQLCSVTLNINPSKIDITKFIENLKILIQENNYEIDIYKVHEAEVKLTCYGITSHSTHPELGINAISRLINILYKIFNLYNIKIELFEYFYKYLNVDYYGQNLDIAFEDESGKLTINIGDFSLKNNILEIGLNIRIPITVNKLHIENTFIKYANQYTNIDFNTISYKPALYIPKEHILVKTLCNVYNEVTNSNLSPIAIGGVTYSRAFNNCVSFGPNFPGDIDMCHQIDEFIDIDKMLLCCKIYAKAIIELDKL